MGFCLLSLFYLQVQGLAEKYFGNWQQDALPASAPSADEPLPRPRTGPRRYEAQAKTGPAIMQAFYRPGVASPEAPVLDVVRSATFAVCMVKAIDKLKERIYRLCSKASWAFA